MNTLHLLDRKVSVVLSVESPKIMLLDGFLSERECDELVALAEPRFADSTVVDPTTGKSVLHPGRTSQGAHFTRAENEVVRRIEQRISIFTQIPTEFGEPIQLQRYGPGHEYKPHYDWFDPTVEGFAKHLVHGGQRQATMIMYLNDVEAGGTTVFPHLKLHVHPKKGSALFFMNIKNGCVDTQVFHGGSPVTTGTKIVANKWLRVSRF